MTENFNILVNKLNSFRLKYYTYQLLKGFILTLFIVLLVFTVFSLIEYLIYLPSEIRKIVFFGFFVFCLLLIIQFIGIPLLKLFRVLRPIDDKSTTKLIQNHFSGIGDKLLNVIELSGLHENAYSDDLLLASIDQKVEQLKIFDFNKAVQFKNIKMVLIYFLISVVITLAMFVSNKAIFTESANRIVHYNTHFTKPAPFTFSLVNSSLKVKKGESLIIEAATSGSEIPQMVYINIAGNNYLMKNTGIGKFTYEMVSVVNPVQFYFTDLRYQSDIHNIELLPKPGLTHFETTIIPPGYTGLRKQVFENIGDLQVPNGTEINWTFSGIDIDSVFIVTGDSVKIMAEKNKNVFYINKKFYKSISYNVFIENNLTGKELALTYHIEVIPDIFPEIQIEQIEDSSKLTRYFFKGIIGDDYGFTKLEFHYNINNEDSVIAIPFVRSMADQDFYFTFDFNNLEIEEGTVNYYFSVTDNDVINNYKTTTSDNFIFEIPNKEEILAKDKEQFDLLQKNLDESRKLAREIQKDLNDLQIKNMDTNISDWEKSQMVNDIVSKQNKLEQLYNQIKKDNQSLNNFMNSYGEQSQEMIEKQKQIEELLEDVFTDELKKLLEEFNKLTEKFNSKQLNNLSEQMELSYEDLQKQLDRNLEILRKMKVEQKIQDAIDQINKVADEEEKLANEIQENRDFEKSKEKSVENQRSVQKAENQIKDALELNKELKKPMKFDDFSEEFDDVEKSFKESQSQLEKGNKKKSGKSIKQTSEKLKNLAFGMQQMLDMNTQQENMENIENLRQILSNLVYLSFSQESVLTDLQNISVNDPLLNNLNKEQKRIKDQSTIVRDSLYALAKRTEQISNTINNELLSMEINLDKAGKQMEEGLLPNTLASQQFVLTAINNLALLLNEALENLEKQMAKASEGNQQCENPGNGKPGMKLLKKEAENIRQQLQKMIDQMKNGQMNGMNKEMGKSLMQHEMMQQMLREMMHDGSVGSGARKMLQEIDDMLEKNRKELINRSINAETLARQNKITTRLLEAEKAKIERDFEDKRESKTADDFYSNPLKFFDYKKDENLTIEYLNKNAHQLNNFYRNKYKQYINNIEK